MRCRICDYDYEVSRRELQLDDDLCNVCEDIILRTIRDQTEEQDWEKEEDEDG